MHFPTDLNLLFDAGRKCLDLVEKYRRSGYALPGWRKAKIGGGDSRRATGGQPNGFWGRAKQGNAGARGGERLSIVGRGLSAKVRPAC